MASGNVVAFPAQTGLRQHLRNVGYLLMSLPLGIAYGGILLGGISVGVATLVVWVGVLILIGMMMIWWRAALWERRLAMHWLQVEIPPLAFADPFRPLSRAGIMDHLRNAMTWRSLAFLLLKPLFGLFAFSITLVFSVVGLCFRGVSLIIGGVLTPFVIIGSLFVAERNLSLMLRRYFSLAVQGFGVSPKIAGVIDRVAQFAGFLAINLLGMSNEMQRRQELRRQIAEERQRADEANRRRRQLVVDLSHELRTPVASINGHLESLLLMMSEEHSLPPPQMVVHNLSIANAEAVRLGQLIDELLSLARMESDELRLTLTPVAPHEVIEAIYDALAPLALHQRQISLVRGTAPLLPPVLADRQRLIQVLANLARNAISYTPTGGLVSLTAERDGDRHVAISVADNGIGIPQADLEHIFERFYRGKQADDQQASGYGLGLAIVYDLVVAMGGSLTVASVEGEGSQFTVQLPIATERLLSDV